MNLYNQIISLLASVAATYSDLVVERATTFCSFEIQLTAVPRTVKTYPVVLLMLSTLPAISASTYPCKTMSQPPKHNALEVVPLKYLRTHYTDFQFSLPRLFIYMLTYLIACPIYGLVHTMEYIKLPTTNELSHTPIL